MGAQGGSMFENITSLLFVQYSKETHRNLTNITTTNNSVVLTLPTSVPLLNRRLLKTAWFLSLIIVSYIQPNLSDASFFILPSQTFPRI